MSVTFLVLTYLAFSPIVVLDHYYHFVAETMFGFVKTFDSPSILTNK